jgi:hypothetical protein
MARLVVWCEWRGFFRRRLVYGWSVRDGHGNIIIASEKTYANLGALHDEVNAVSFALTDAVKRPVPIHGP